MRTDSLIATYAAPAEKSRPSAKVRERRGKVWLVAGTLIALFGVALYCTTMIVGDLRQEPVQFRTEGLLTIGVGLAIWLFGALKYLNALMEQGPRGDL